jgi:hypothetical protein
MGYIVEFGRIYFGVAVLFAILNTVLASEYCPKMSSKISDEIVLVALWFIFNIILWPIITIVLFSIALCKVLFK